MSQTTRHSKTVQTSTQSEPFPSETPNGIRKRFEHVVQLLTRFAPKRVLDFGCGTGTNLTIPLAEHFPDITFVGVDNDPGTVEFASKVNTAPNLSFALIEGADAMAPYDMIILSEVLEHVEEPGDFLLYLRERLRPGGLLLVTTPNGFGPFEMTAFAESILYIIGIGPLAERIVKRGRSALSRPTMADTLAISPHVNFFSMRRLRKLIAASGFRTIEFRPRTFLCGLGFHQLLFTEGLRRWNARVSDSLPAICASGWMFLLERTPDAAPASLPYHRTLYERMRRYLTAKRWKLI